MTLLSLIEALMRIIGYNKVVIKFIGGKMQKCNIYNCNIYVAQKYIKHKWIPIIIYLLNREQQMSFTSLLNNIEFISNKRLSASLKTLTDNSIIDKLENGEYVLTSTGSELAMIISLMSSFDGEYK